LLDQSLIDIMQDASWWLVIGNEFQDKVLGVKKIYFKRSLKKYFQIQLPKSFESSPKLRVYLLSDSYLGLDQIIDVNLLTERKK